MIRRAWKHYSDMWLPWRKYIAGYRVRTYIRDHGVQCSNLPGEVGCALLELWRSSDVGDEPKVLVISDTDLNAASVGEGLFIVGQPLVELANPWVAWGVAAHEIAHDVLQHVTWWRAAMIAKDLISFGMPVARPVAFTATRVYSRAQEIEADADAVRRLTVIGRPGWTMRYALEFLQEAYGDCGGGWFSTHPHIGERIKRLPSVDESVATATVSNAERKRQLEHLRVLAQGRKCS